MTPLQQALSKFKPPFRYDKGMSRVVDSKGDFISFVDAADVEMTAKEYTKDQKAIGAAIADFLNTAVKKTDADI
jgi:hypothetical protein